MDRDRSNKEAKGYMRVMPFGKYKWKRIEELEDSYLVWLYSLPDLRDPLATWVEEEFTKRQQGYTDTKPPRNAATSCAPPPRCKELVEAGFKALARLHHPDVGGTDTAMRESLEARSWLTEILTKA